MRRAVLALLLAGCSYDWAVSGTSPDAAHDVAPIDATSSDVSDAAPVDAVSEPSVDASPDDSPGGSDADASPPPVDAAECQALLQNAMNALGPALDCTQGANDCAAKTQDWCGCDIYLSGTQPAYTSFVTAVMNFVSAGCRSSPTIFCPPCFDAGANICVLYDAGPGKYRCYY